MIGAPFVAIEAVPEKWFSALLPKDSRKVRAIERFIRSPACSGFESGLWGFVASDGSPAVAYRTRNGFSLSAGSEVAAWEAVQAICAPSLLSGASFLTCTDIIFHRLLESHVGAPATASFPSLALHIAGPARESLLRFLETRSGPILEPHGLTLTELTPGDTARACQLWPSSRGDEVYVRSRIEAGPSAAIRDAQGIVVAMAFTHPYGALGGLHVVPEHRRKGLAKVVIAKMVLNGVDWLHTEEGNETGRKTFEALGFLPYESMDTWLSWVPYRETLPIG